MLHELVTDPGSHSAESLHAALLAELADAVDRAGVDAVVDETDLDAETVETVHAGEDAALTVEEAAAVLAVAADDAADDIVHLSRDALMMGMSRAVLDVEALAAEAGGTLEPREIQSKLEGRYPMTLREFALLHATIEKRVR